MPKHVLHYWVLQGVFYIVPPDFQYHNEKKSSQWETKRGKKLPQMLSGRIIRENYWLKQLPDGFASL